MLKKFVIGFGFAIGVFGVYLLSQGHATTEVCAGALSVHTGGGCTGFLLSYVEGFILVIGGLINLTIALMMGAPGERAKEHRELHAVPRSWGKSEIVLTSSADGGVVRSVRRLPASTKSA